MSLTYPQDLHCALCNARAVLTMIEAASRGWNWFTQYLPERAEICPNCMRTRRNERDHLFTLAHQRPALPQGEKP